MALISRFKVMLRCAISRRVLKFIGMIAQYGNMHIPPKKENKKTCRKCRYLTEAVGLFLLHKEKRHVYLVQT